MKKQRNFVLTGLILIAIGLVSYAAKYGFNVLLARNLSAGLYGDFVIGWRSFSLLASLLLFGSGAAAKRFLPNMLKETHVDLPVYLRWNFAYIARGAIAFLILLSLFTVTLIALHLYNIKSILSYHLAIYLLYLSPIGALTCLLVSYIQCNRNSYLGAFFNSGAQYVLFVGLLVPAFYFIEISFSISTLWLTVLCVFVLLSLIEVIILFIKAPSFIGLIKKTRQLKEKKQIKDWPQTSVRLMLNQIIFLVMTVTDIYLVEILLKQESAVDKYAAVTTICGIIWLISGSLYRYVAPRVSPATETGNYQKLQQMINSLHLVNFIVSCLVVGSAIFLGHFILASFGSHYVTPATETALIIMASSYALGSFSKPATMLVAYSGYEKALTKVSSLEFLLLIISGIPLTIEFGIVGTATAAAIAVLSKAIFIVYYAKKHIPCKPLGLF